MLLDIKNYLLSRQKVSLHELTHHFHVPAEVILPMIEIWIAKGKIIRCSKASHCGVKCVQCRPTTVEWFEWVKNNE
jgi:putative ferrous iron transport protein C